MQNKIFGVACLALSAMSQAFISHDDTAMFYSALFFLIGGFELGAAYFYEWKDWLLESEEHIANLKRRSTSAT